MDKGFAMGLYKYLKETFQQEHREASPLYKKRLVEWRRAGVVERIEKPTNLARAREIGYKDKQGFVVVRAKIKRGRRKRPKLTKRIKRPARAAV